jgi:hypothetical protein
MIGRPSKFTEKIAQTICERIAGGESLRTICAADDMPDKATVLRWLTKGGPFRDQYTRAREDQVEHYADEIIDIADNTVSDSQRDRLRVDTRKWLMGKLAPKKYGERITQEVTGAVHHEHEHRVSPEQVKRDLGEVFGTAIVAVIGGPIVDARADNPMVRQGPQRSRGKKRRASKAGKALAGAE